MMIVAIIIALSGCGGSGGGSSPSMMPSPIEGEFPELPPQRPLHSVQAPIVDLGNVWHVGADVAPSAEELQVTGTHIEAIVSYGKVQDGVGANEVIAYLDQLVFVDGGEFKSTPGLATFSVQPTVRLAEGTSDAFIDLTLRAIQLVNATLPHEKRILFGSDSAPSLAAIDDVPDGEIFIDFVPWEDWNDPLKPPHGEAAGEATGHINLIFNDQYFGQF